jgi:hypothetical protein
MRWLWLLLCAIARRFIQSPHYVSSRSLRPGAFATPIVALWTSFVWYPLSWLLHRGEYFPVLLLLHGSAVGSSGYWLLVRRFWIRSLQRRDLLKTLMLCVAATLLVTVASDVVSAKMDFKLKRPEVWANGSDCC